MIKIFTLILIFILSNFVGRIIAKKYINRWKELKEIKNALNVFKAKIRFTYEPIPEAFEEISMNSNIAVKEIFMKAKDNMKLQNAGEAWRKAVLESKNNLTQEDKETLNMLSKSLGESDLEGQINQIDMTLSFLDKQLEDAEKEKNKNEKLYRKLGTVMGLALVIILI